MDFTEAVRRRRMVRRFDPDRPVSVTQVTALVELARLAPSAGYTQGQEYLALVGPEHTRTFWSATTDPDNPPDRWLVGVSAAPALVLCLSHPEAYLDRYAEPDKGWTDRAVQRWPIPYWDTDTAMGAMILLLAAVDASLGALFFGVPAERHDAVRAALGIPQDRRIVGVVALGHPLPHPPSPSLRRGRRDLDQVLSVGRFGESATGASGDSATMAR